MGESDLLLSIERLMGELLDQIDERNFQRLQTTPTQRAYLEAFEEFLRERQPALYRGRRQKMRRLLREVMNEADLEAR